jgi:hypothetical protein
MYKLTKVSFEIGLVASTEVDCVEDAHQAGGLEENVCVVGALQNDFCFTEGIVLR